MSEICLICLKINSDLLTIGKNDDNHDDILQKLMECIPELDWSQTFQICRLCSQQVHEVHSFKVLCITSYASYWLLKKSAELVKEEKHILLDSKTDLNIQSFNQNSGIGNSQINKKCDSEHEVKLEEESKKNDNKNIESEQDSSAENNQPSDNDYLSDYKEEPEIKTKRRKIKSIECKRVPCEICGKVYASKYVLKRHTKICLLKHDSGNNETSDKQENIKETPSCSDCGITFKNKYLQKRHIDNVHTKEKKFICDICNRSFASMVYLNAHKRYHSRDRPHVCSSCGKGYITTSDLYHHEKIHANKRNYRCEICPKAFNTSSDLYKHKICVHMDRSLWKYPCEICQRKFPLKINLDSHKKTHTGEKNFPCHLCDRKCINMSVLKRHLQTHSHLFFFKCEICEQAYKFQKSLDVHKANAHGIGTVKMEPAVKKFVCPLCSKPYSANNKLQKHLRAHVGEKPFKCPECHKGFTDKSYVKHHMKSAHSLSKEDY